MRDVEWGALIREGRENGNWSAYRYKREQYMEHVRVTMLSAPPRTRFYVRLAGRQEQKWGLKLVVYKALSDDAVGAAAHSLQQK